MTRQYYSGQPGNTVPVVPENSTDTLQLDYQLGIRRPCVAIGTTSYNVSATQSGTMFTYGGIAKACSIVLPAPEPGLWFEFAATGAIVSSGTKFNCATADAFIVARNGTSGGVGTIQANATSVEFALGGVYLEFIGVSTSQYLCKQFGGGTSVASTACFLGAS